MIRLDPEWRVILRKAWSVRFMAIAIVLTAVDTFFPLFIGESLPLAFASLFFSLSAFFARIMAQKDVP